MDSDSRWIISLTDAAGTDADRIGGKAVTLGRLSRQGFRIPAGFCVTVAAYEQFIEENSLTNTIRLELGRKPLDDMRWEEIWDAALRIRSAFLTAQIPTIVVQEVSSALEELGQNTMLAVRSSAPGEDSLHCSFAGLHESVIGVVGAVAVLDAIRRVWSSLWSDAALLYRRELSLDPAHSRMSVLVQKMVYAERSGVAFGRDPRDVTQDRIIIEAVVGECRALVDGAVDPDRWILQRSTGQLLDWRPGDRASEDNTGRILGSLPLLDEHDLNALWRMLLKVESHFGWPPDVEWTGQQEQLTLLQARPITTGVTRPTDTRAWYLTLRPGRQRLRALAQRVAEQLIPQLEEQGKCFAAEILERYDDAALALALDERAATLQRWRKIYWDEFIPFAHGVRQLGLYYNDAVRPQDSYEFVGLLKSQPMVAAQRNAMLQDLVIMVKENEPLLAVLRQNSSDTSEVRRAPWAEVCSYVQRVSGGRQFIDQFEAFRSRFTDVVYDGERLIDRPDLFLATLLELTQQPSQQVPSLDAHIRHLEKRLLDAVGEDRQKEAHDILSIGRLSWRLRDDDNVLLGQLESQLLRALHVAATRLQAAGRLPETAHLEEQIIPLIATALREPQGGTVVLPLEQRPAQSHSRTHAEEHPRQLVGQPAAPGLATGKVRRLQNPEDLGRFRAGEVLVCDAIQPTMTHLVPLASAIVERRGGMLIHGAIIARELNLPCVNGVANVVELLSDGELVTVDGYLGIITVGAPDFALETKASTSLSQ